MTCSADPQLQSGACTASRARTRARGHLVRPAPSRGRRLLAAAGRLAAGAASLGGLPYALARLAGWPVPRHLPTGPQLRALLAAPMSGQDFLKIVACATWLLWAVFALSVIAEIAAAARGRPALRLPGARPVQALAAALAGTTVLTAVAPASPLAAALPAALVHAAPATLRQPASPWLSAAPGRTGPRAQAVRLAGTRRGRVHHLGASRPRLHHVAEGDNLWDIAGRYLGDGERWHEIFTLNQGRPQPGGQELTDPRLIEPGWVLRLPPAPLARPAGSGHARASRPAPATPPPARAHRPPHGPHAHPQPPAPRATPGPGGPGICLPSGGLAGIGLATAVTAALTLIAISRRRRYRPGHALTSSLTPAWTLLPPPIATLRRAATWQRPATTGDGQNTCPARPGSGAWPPHPAAQARPAARRPGPAAGRPQPPGVIALGIRGGREIVVDLTAVGGLGLTGPGAAAAARAILAGLLARAVPGLADGPAQVIMPAADAAVLLPGWHPDLVRRSRIPGLIITGSLEAALSQAEAILVRRARESGIDELTGDPPSRPPSAALPPAVLIAAPSPAAAPRLRAVAGSASSLGLAAILLGAWPPGVTGHVAADGTLTSADPALDGTRLFHLGDVDTAAVISLLQAACATPATGNAPRPSPPNPAPSPRARPAPRSPRQGQTPSTQTTRTTTSGENLGLAPVRPGTAPGGSSPAAASASRPPGQPLMPAPAPSPQPAQPAPAGDARQPDSPDRRVIGVEVLGPLRITARGSEIHGGLRKARELLAFLAMHPAGATADAISEALWPGSPPSRSAAQRTLALRKARSLLRAAAGVTGPMLIILTAGRYRLDPTFIATDIAGFQAALDQARRATDDDVCLAACQQAAALYRGPLTDEAGYEWAEPYAEAARRRALDAWTRIAEILEPASPGQALAALEIALGHDPYNEYLYQRIMHLQAAAGRPEAVARTLRLLETRLAELGLSPDPATRQAAQQAAIEAARIQRP